MAQTMEDLLAELRKKDEELVLAASYGKALLEEKEQLWEELQSAQEEIRQLEESLQSLRHQSQKTLNQAKAEADHLVADLESRLHTANRTIEEEQSRHKSTKEEYQKALVSLHTENSNLRVEINLLSNEKDKENDRVRKVSDALKQSETDGQVASLQQEELEKQVERLQSTNKGYAEDVSTLAHTCDQLTQELQNVRNQLENWEIRYSLLNEELLTQHKELEDSREITKQLEAELDRQRSMAASPTSTMSLHDELSQSLNSLDMLPDALPPPESGDETTQTPETDRMEEQMELIKVHDSRLSLTSTLRRPSDQSLMSTLRASDHTHIMMWSSGSEGSPSPCPRCKSLNDQVGELKQELSAVSDQLLAAVQQKIKLQEQNEAWQNDMAEMVEQNLHHKLDIEQHTQPHPASKPEKHKKSSPKKKKASPSNKENSDDVFRREFIKKSWYF